MIVAYFGPGGGGSEGEGAFFQGCDPVGVVVCGGDMVTDPHDGAVPD